MSSYRKSVQLGLALDPIHVGTGGAHIGRVDLTIVRDPVIQVPKIPGSSLAGVYRTYVAMAEQDHNPNRQINGQLKPYYPDCAGLGLDANQGHCRQPNCPVCTVFGFARGAGQEGGFAGLAAFTDAHVLLFPVPTRRGPMWITSAMMLEMVNLEVNEVEGEAVYLGEAPGNPLNLGWLLLGTRRCNQMDAIKTFLESLGVPDYIRNRLALVPDRLFAHIVNSNLEVRTSVSINPQTGAAEDKALFSYEALPRGTVLLWEIIAKNPVHFRIGTQTITAVTTPDDVHEKAKQAHPYLEHLGIGGMGTRGMGRIQVLYEAPLPSQAQADGASTPTLDEEPSAEEEEESHE